MLLMATLTTALPALAVPPGVEADERFRRGVQLVKENNYAAALVEFQRAYQIDPKYQVLYNIGESYYQLQDYANALRTFQRYLAEGGSRIAAKRRKEVEAEMVTLSARVAMLTILTSEPGAAVTVDDVAVGTTPLATLMVNAGRRKVTATLPGRFPVTGTVDLAGRDRQTIRLEIGPPPGRGEQPKPRPPPPSIIPQTVAWSATGAFVTGAVITGILALRASSDLADELVRFPGDAEALASAKDSAFRLGLATDILIGTSLAAAGISIYFTVDWVLESDAAGSAPPPARRPARLTVLPGGVAVEGSF